MNGIRLIGKNCGYSSFCSWRLSSLPCPWGYSSLPLDRILQVLSGNGAFKENYVFYQIRLPRALVLTMAGACLAGAGIILQTLSNNDLADSGLLGINSGAGLGVTIFYLYAGEGMLQFSAALPLVAFLSALVAASTVYLLSYSRSHKQHAMQLVVIGAGISSAFSGLIILLMSSSDRTDVSFITAWMSGNIWGSTWPFVFTILPGWLLAMGILFLKAPTLNILALGEETALALGLRLRNEKLILLLCAVAIASAAISLTGNIGFIGLMSPHIAKKLGGKRHERYSWLALLIGSIILLVADAIGRTVMDTAFPTGIVVSLIGAPYFLYLLLGRMR